MAGISSSGATASRCEQKRIGQLVCSELGELLRAQPTRTPAGVARGQQHVRQRGLLRLIELSTPQVLRVGSAVEIDREAHGGGALRAGRTALALDPARD